MLTWLVILALLWPLFWVLRVLFVTKALVGLEFQRRKVVAVPVGESPAHLREAARPWIVQLGAPRGFKAGDRGGRKREGIARRFDAFGTGLMQSGSTATQSGAIAPESGAIATGSGATALESGMTSLASGSVLPESGGTAPESGAAALQSGGTANESGTVATQSGAVARESGATATGSGAAALESAAIASESGSIPLRSGMSPTQLARKGTAAARSARRWCRSWWASPMRPARWERGQPNPLFAAPASTLSARSNRTR